MIVQISYLDHNPFWSFTIIIVDVLIIYGLVAHGGRIDEWSTGADRLRRSRRTPPSRRGSSRGGEAWVTE